MKIECIKWIMKACPGKLPDMTEKLLTGMQSINSISNDIFVDPETNSTEPDEILHSFLSHLGLPSLRCVFEQDTLILA